MKKLFLLFSLISFSSCAELQQIAEQYPETRPLSNAEIANGLKEALNQGIETEVTKLTEEGGFFSNELVRIGLPPELQKVDRTLRDVGLDELADRGLRFLNRAAEEAVKEATPIFVSAVQEMSITDARDILLGADNAATSYLSEKTSTQLYQKFNPVVQASMDRVGANDIWRTLIERYNALPLTTEVNPDLTDYVTREALEGVYTMISVEEQEIRNQLGARTSDLLRRVFALQD